MHMKTASKEIKTRPVKEEYLSAKNFLKVNPKDIKRSRVIPPRIGSKSFGKIHVEYKHTIYKPA